MENNYELLMVNFLKPGVENISGFFYFNFLNNQYSMLIRNIQVGCLLMELPIPEN